MLGHERAIVAVGVDQAGVAGRRSKLLVAQRGNGADELIGRVRHGSLVYRP